MSFFSPFHSFSLTERKAKRPVCWQKKAFVQTNIFRSTHPAACFYAGTTVNLCSDLELFNSWSFVRNVADESEMINACHPPSALRFNSFLFLFFRFFYKSQWCMQSQDSILTEVVAVEVRVTYSTFDKSLSNNVFSSFCIHI